MRWNILSSQTPHSIKEVISTLLTNRHIANAEQFLHATSPLEFLLSDVGIDEKEVTKALLRLDRAREQKEPIVIYGDYDADGVCATTVLWETMYKLGFTVTPFIPHRERHGYGLSQKGVDEIIGKRKPAIIISVDNGIVAHEQWQRLKELDIFTILTDHHEPDEHKPDVDCLIHTTALCGTTVSWMFAREIEKRFSGKSIDSVDQMLDLCAIATIADQVPLTGANRSFAKYGLAQLNRTSRLGLQLLIESAGLQLGEIDTYGVNYGLAPRINAMGRLESALDAMRALCTHKREKAVELITKLQDTNRTRQDLTQELLEKALSRSGEWKDEHIIVIDDVEFHEGVIGLIAGKLTEIYNKPTIALSVGPLTAKGSARSLGGVHITNLLREFRGEYLIEVGGHPLAAGLKIEIGKIESFKQAIYLRARELISLEELEPVLDIDCVLLPDLLHIETVTNLQTLSPFGSGNREPLFEFDNMEITNLKLVGKEGKHLKIVLTYPNADAKFQTLEAMAFGKGKRLDELHIGQKISLVGHVSINEWKGSKKLQIMVRDFHSME